jgi:hypothetical protein
VSHAACFTSAAAGLALCAALIGSGTYFLLNAACGTGHMELSAFAGPQEALFRRLLGPGRGWTPPIFAALRN